MIDINNITPEMIEAEEQRRAGASSPTAASTAFDPNNVTEDQIAREENRRSNLPLANVKDVGNQSKWEALMTGGDAVEGTKGSVEDNANAKLPGLVQAGVGAVSFGNAAIDRMLKMGVAANNLVGLETPFSLKELQSVTTKPVSDAVNKVSGDGDKLSSLFGLNTKNVGEFAGDLAPSFLLPQMKMVQGASALSKIGTAAVNGGIQGSTYAASEAANGSSSIGEVVGGAALGGTIGALFGGAAQGTLGAIGGIAKYVGNNFKSVNADKAKAMTNSLLDDIGAKSTTVADDTFDTANAIYKDISLQNKDIIKGFYDSAYKKEISAQDFKALNSNPNIADTIKRYRNSLLTDNSRDNAIAARYQRLNNKMVDGKVNPDYNPNSLESWDYITRSMQDDINKLFRNEQTSNASLVVDARNSVLKQLDAISPDYANARALSQENKAMTELFDNVNLDQLTKSQSQAYKKISNMLLDTKNPPENIIAIRDAFVKKNPEVWKNIVRETFENRTNAVSGLNDSTPLDFMHGVMRDKGKANMVYEALNFPGNEKTLAKLEALGLIYKDVNKVSVADNVLDTGLSNIPFIGNIKRNKVNEFNKKATDFIFSTKYDRDFDNLVAQHNQGLTPRDIANETIKMLLPDPNPGKMNQAVRNTVIDKSAEVAGSLFNKDTK